MAGGGGREIEKRERNVGGDDESGIGNREWNVAGDGESGIGSECGWWW